MPKQVKPNPQEDDQETVRDSEAETDISGRSVVGGMDKFFDATSTQGSTGVDIDSDDEITGRAMHKERDPRQKIRKTPKN